MGTRPVEWHRVQHSFGLMYHSHSLKFLIVLSLSFFFEMKFNRIIKFLHKQRRYTQSACKSPFATLFMYKVHDAQWTQNFNGSTMLRNSTSWKVKIRRVLFLWSGNGTVEGCRQLQRSRSQFKIRTQFAYRKKEMAFYKTQTSKDFYCILSYFYIFCVATSYMEKW